MSQISLNVFDIFTKRQTETIQYEFGYGNFTKLKMELAMRRKIIYFNDIILKNSDGKLIQSQDDLEDQQQIWFDCPNPIYDVSKKKQHQLSISEHIISLKTQLNTQQSLQQKNFLKSMQLSNKKSEDKRFQLSKSIIDQKYDMKQSTIQNTSSTFDNIQESQSFVFQDRNSSKSERVISKFQSEISSVIGEAKCKRQSVQLDALKSAEEFYIQQNQNENNKEAVKQYFELKEKHQDEIRKIEEEKQIIYEKMKQSKPHELKEYIDKMKNIEEVKQQKLQKQQQEINQLRQFHETTFRYKIFEKVNDIQKEMDQMTNYFKTSDSKIIDKIKCFSDKIKEIEKISKEKIQQMPP